MVKQKSYHAISFLIPPVLTTLMEKEKKKAFCVLIALSDIGQ